MPTVSIILPTYNRAHFLPQALASIQAQQFTDWELIVVDDGSTDDTCDLVRELTQGWKQPVCYHWQENQGAYGARNTGLDLTTGEYIAFYDSDDDWLPHHLADCMAGFAANDDVDWVYAAIRVLDFASGRILAPNIFYVGSRPRQFLQLRTRAAGRLRIIDDPKAIACAILTGLYAGLQNSVIRQRVFATYRFEALRRNEAEDQLLVIRALTAGYRLAYLDNIHVTYRIHEQNSSAAGAQVAPERHVRVLKALVEGYEELRGQLDLTTAQARALNARLSREYFWNLGYFLLGMPGRGPEAVALMRRGLRLRPWNLPLWKTYLLNRLRVALSNRGDPASTACTPY